MENEIRYQGVKKSKILLARFIDFCYFLILAFILTATTVFITVITPSFSSMLDKAQEIQLNSNLYVKSKKDDSVIKLTIALNEDKDLTTDYKNLKLSEALNNFYKNEKFFKDNEGVTFYNNLKKDAKEGDKNLFVLKNGEYVENKEAGIIPSSYLSFYSNTLNKKATAALQNDPLYHSLSQSVTKIFIIESITMPLIIYVILFVLVPVLSTKNHSTLGFKNFKIGIVDGNGFVLSGKKLAGAIAFNSLIVTILSFFTFFIPLIISFGMFLFRQDNKNLTSYVFNYYYVDVSNHKIYKTEEEYQGKVEYIENNSELFSNTPLEDDKCKKEN